MKRFTYFSLGIIGLFFTSCVEDKDLSVPTEEVSAGVGLAADFSLRSMQSISITAVDGNGVAGEGVRFGVFTQQPYTSEGGIDISPVFIGYTNASGQLEAKVPVANNVSELYVVPFTAGYGEMQIVEARNSASLTFSGVPFSYSAAVSRAATDGENTPLEIPAFYGPLSSNYQIYIPYSSADVDTEAIPYVDKSSLISKETLSTELLNQINAWYPEKQNVQNLADLSKNSDLIVNNEGGAKVWVTYVGDGGFYESNRRVYNSLMYYHYKEGDLNEPDDVNKLRITMLLPNTHGDMCPTGLKIQLLYWDAAANAYSENFPKGTRIGFAVAREGLSTLTQNVTTPASYDFKDKSYPRITLNQPQGMYYSTPMLNSTGRAQAVSRALEGHQCCVTGFDIRPFGDSLSDYDFNDVLVKVTADPNMLEPVEPIPPVDPSFAESTHGTLAFEDQWPNPGDYDLNDFVVNYTYSLYKNTRNQIDSIQMTLEPIARGSADYMKIGFGIELPLAMSNVDAAKVKGATLESGNSKATLIVWEDTRQLFGATTGFINVEKGSTSVSAEKIVVTVPMTTPVSADELSVLKFNPFIFVNGQRSHEVHLTDFAPTEKIDDKLFGTGADCSDPFNGLYYRMENKFCWALDFPRETADAPAWRYPKEKSSVENAYNYYNNWVLNKQNFDWFDSSKSGYVNEDELYK